MKDPNHSILARVVLFFLALSALWLVFSNVEHDPLGPGEHGAARSGLPGDLLFVAGGAVGIFLILSHDLRVRRRLEVELALRERRFRQIFDSSADALFVLDRAGRIIDANRVAERQYGYDRDRLLAMTAKDLAPERLHGKVKEHVNASLAGGIAFEWCHRRADGSEMAVEVGAAPVEIDGRPFVLSSVRDISQRKVDDARIGNLLRTHAVLRDINQAIVHERDQAELFGTVCRIAVQEGKFRMAWVGLADPLTGAVEPVAHAGEGDGYLQKLGIALSDPERGLGPTARALREGRHVVCNDVANDPTMAPWRDDALRLGYKASAAFPLTVSGRTVGSLNLYADMPGFFNAAELELLDAMAMDVSFAIQAADDERRREQAERDLRISEGRYRTLFEHSIDAILISSPDGRIHAANPAACALLGRSEEEICGVGRPGLVDGADPRLPELLQQRERTGNALGVLTMVRKDGTKFEGEISSAVFATAEGPRTSMIIRDISERRKAEDALREKEILLSESQRIAEIGSWNWDIPSVALSWSDQAYCIFGVSPDSFSPTQESFHGMIHYEDLPAMVEWTRACLAGENPGELEFRIVRPDGGLRFLSGRGDLRRVDEGAPLRMVGTVQDITRRKQVESELDLYRLRLEDLVRERTAELEAKTVELVKAKERAESADRLKSAFLATMSHELRTPLNSVIGFTGILLQEIPGPLNEEQRKQLGMVRASARHLLALINDVLDISKIEAGEFQIEHEPFEVSESVRAAAGAVRQAAEEKGLDLELFLQPDLGSIIGDHLRFEQVLLNMLGNALKFTDTGGITIRVRRTRGAAIETTVQDTGIGIAKEDQAAVFQPFHQVGNGANRRYEGTGLGLSISKRLVELMGGMIWVDGAIGAGSLFGFTVPARIADGGVE